MSERGALAGRVVLLLRPEERAAALAQRLRDLGARTLHAPVIAFGPPHDEGAAHAALRALARYDLVVFTSATGVRAFVERARSAPFNVRLETLRAAAVGPGTASALRAAGIEPVVVASAARVEGLRAELERLAPLPSAILVVGPEGEGAVAFDALRARGARVDAVAFYRTIPAEGGSRAALVLSSGAADAVVFTSPSTFRFLVESGAAAGLDCAAALRGVRRVAIGPVTAAALAAAGFEAHAIAAEPTPESVSDAVLRALRSDGSVW